MTKAKLSELSHCTNRQGEINISTGDQFKKCLKKFHPKAEMITHGQNPNIGLKKEKIEITESERIMILEENVLKKIDRALHAGEYEQLKDELQRNRAQVRSTGKSIRELQAEFQGVKNSPQGAELQKQIDAKIAEQTLAQEQLRVYQDLNRKGLGITPETYKINKAKGEGLKLGSLAGLTAGGIAGLGAGKTFFGESMELKIGKLLGE